MGFLNFFDRTTLMSLISNVTGRTLINIESDLSKIYDNSKVDVAAKPEIGFDKLKEQWISIIKANCPVKTYHQAFTVKLIIEFNGNVSDISITSELTPKINNHLALLFKQSFNKWSPAQIGNRRVRSMVCVENIFNNN